MSNTVMENMVLPRQKHLLARRMEFLHNLVNFRSHWFIVTTCTSDTKFMKDFSIASGIQAHTHNFWPVPMCLPHSEVKLLNYPRICHVIVGVDVHYDSW